MKASNFTGMPNVPNQDMAMWLAMGAADTTHDLLCTRDLAMGKFRTPMVQTRKDFQQGTGIGAGDRHIPASVCAFQNAIPKTSVWGKDETH